jgi:hypothetical protein
LHACCGWIPAKGCSKHAIEVRFSPWNCREKRGKEIIGNPSTSPSACGYNADALKFEVALQYQSVMSFLLQAIYRAQAHQQLN